MKAMKEMNKQKYYIFLFSLMFVVYSIFMSFYYFYNINYRGMKVTNIGKIQNDYSQYLVSMNDDFIDYMIEFEELTKIPQKEYSSEELTLISKNLKNQNNIMYNLQANPPNVKNKDYLEIYKDFLKLYAFYIQGEVMRVEYISAYKVEYTQEEISGNLIANEETYIMGIELCNMIGNLILENPTIVNKIHNTNAISKHNTIPLNEWLEQVKQKELNYEPNKNN